MKEQNMIYSLDGKPPLKIAIPLGMQHILAMFTGNIAPIIIICNVLQIPIEQKTLMIQCAMLVAGIVTLVCLYPIGPVGARLPLVVGTSFAFVPTAIAVGKMYGIAGVLGASFVGSLAEVFLGVYLKKLRKFFPPLVTGVVLIAIGMSLMPVGINYFAGGVGAKDFGSPQNLFLGFTVMTIVVLLQRFGKGMFNLSAMLIALVIGYMIAIPMGKINFDTIASAGWMSFPMPLQLGLEFHLDAIIKFALVYLVVGLETLGNVSAITLGGANREATDREMSGAVIADAAGSALGALFNVLPNTAYGQNAGIVAMTGVMNRFCVATGAMFLILAGFFPKFGAICAAMPPSVLGGAVVLVFAMITISGIKMIGRGTGLDSRNSLILAVALGLGLGFPMVPAALEFMPGFMKFFFEDAVVASGITALVLNIVLPPVAKLPDEEVSSETLLEA